MLPSLKKTFNNNPVDTYYSLDIDKTRLASFSSIQGGDIELQMVRHNVVYNSGEYSTLLIPGPTRYNPVTLSNGYGNTTELYNWFITANNGRVVSARKNVSIHLNSYQEGKYVPLISWNLINALPVKISGFQSDQKQNSSVAVFSITMVAESIQRVDP